MCHSLEWFHRAETQPLPAPLLHPFIFSLSTSNQADLPPRTATLRDLAPAEKAKVSSLLRRVLSLSEDNRRLSSSAAATAATREEETLELRKRLDVALDSLSEARRRAEAAEAKLRAAVGSCVCGAAAGTSEVGGARGGEEEGEREENFGSRSRSSSNSEARTAAPPTRRNLVFNEARGAFEFEAKEQRGQQGQPRRGEAAEAASFGSSDASASVAVVTSAPPPPPKQQQRETAKSLQALVADVEASLAAAALRR